MIEDAPPEHHAKAPRAPIPIQNGPERRGEPLSSEADFVERQLEMWVDGPVPIYHTALAQHIVAESYKDQDLRPGKSEKAVAWEERLSLIANDETLDDIELTYDLSTDLFVKAKKVLLEDDLRLQAIIILERMHNVYYQSLTLKQKYEEEGMRHTERIEKLIHRIMTQHSIRQP